MRNNEKLSKAEIGEIFTAKDIDLLREFTELLNFDGISFEMALRCFLEKFTLPGESQQISRFMEVFAAKYVKSNPGIFPDADAVFVLAFSVIMLNTDAHNLAIAEKSRMTKDQFIKNNSGTWNGENPPTPLLESLYDSIVCNEIQMKTKGDPDKKGWIKSIKATSYEQDLRWLCLIGNELRWYKNPTLGKDQERLLGSIKLEYVMIKETRNYLSISNTLPKPLSYCIYEEKPVMMTTMEFLIFCETETAVENWARAIRNNVTFDVLPDFSPKQFKKPKPTSKHKKTKKF